MYEWEPKVADLLRETLQSEKRDNLTVLSEIAQPQFLDLVSRNQDSFFSPEPEERDSSRYLLLGFVLGEHYELKISTDPKESLIPFSKDALRFLEGTTGRIDSAEILSSKLPSQANMWVEALYRAYAAAWELDPTINDGVFLPENQTFYGRTFAPKERFVRLQYHLEP